MLILSAFVIEYPAGGVAGTPAEELAAAYLLSSKATETSRRPVSHGAGKHPGLDVTTRSGKLYGRRLVVVVGHRLYELAATGTSEELLARPEVGAFFDSLAVGG